MNPLSHFFLGWSLSNVDPSLGRRERACITLAGVVPDLDGLGIIAEKLTLNTETPLLWWSEYHHVLGHNLLFALVVAAVSFALAVKRWRTAMLAFVSFHIHLLGDVIGGRGPDGFQWPIYYLYPFSDSWRWVWQGQWALNAWQNFVITIAALSLTFYLAWKRGYSPLELFSSKADRAFVLTLRNRFPIRADE